MFTYVDLFSGSGGLSLGLQRAGGKHVLAVEKSPMASETYFRNLISNDGEAWNSHLNLELEEQARAGLVVGPVDSVLRSPQVLRELKEQEIDLVAGGPPCQGFSLAGRRNASDPRNRLAWEFLEFVEAVRPRLVLIENVVGMDRKYRPDGARTPFESLQVALRQRGYRPQGVLLNAVHFGAPQSRPRLMILAVREDVGEALGIEPTGALWKSGFLDGSAPADGAQLLPAPTVTFKDRRTVADAISDLLEVSGPARKAETQKAYLSEMRDASLWRLAPSGDTAVANLDHRNHRSSTTELFQLIQILSSHELLRDARRARIEEFDGDDASTYSRLVHSLQFPLTSPDGSLTFEDAASLLSLTRKRLTLKHSQTVLQWEQPSRTVVTIPDDYIHPIAARTFSVRELARLQGFPDDFIFYGKVTTGGHSRRTEVPQYSQVGNAVSPYVALAIGRLVRRLSSTGPAS